MSDDQFAAYRNTKPTRPTWATALIVAAIIALGGIVFAVMGSPAAWWFFLAAVVAAIIAGIAALAKVGRRG